MASRASSHVMWQGICGVVIRRVRNENGGGRIVARLHLEPGPVDGPAVETRRRSGLQPPHAKSPAPQSVSDRPGKELHRRGPAGIFSSPMWISPRRNVPVVRMTAPALMDAPLAVITPATLPSSPGSGLQPHRPAGQGRLFGQRRLHRLTVKAAVSLGAGAANGRSLASVEQAELDTGPIGDPAHDAVERVDLPHKMALAQPADGGIAGHLADGFKLVGEQERTRADARRRRSRFTTSVAATDHNDVIVPHGAHFMVFGARRQRKRQEQRCFT